MERDDLNGRMMLSSRGDDDAIVLSIVEALKAAEFMRPNDRARTIDDAFNGRAATLLLDIANHTRVHCFN